MRRLTLNAWFNRGNILVIAFPNIKPSSRARNYNACVKSFMALDFENHGGQFRHFFVNDFVPYPKHIIFRTLTLVNIVPEIVLSSDKKTQTCK